MWRDVAGYLSEMNAYHGIALVFFAVGSVFFMTDRTPLGAAFLALGAAFVAIAVRKKPDER